MVLIITGEELSLSIDRGGCDNMKAGFHLVKKKKTDTTDLSFL